MSQKKDPPEYVMRNFCDERALRIEQTIKTAKAEIINEVKEAIKSAVNGQRSMGWKAKAAIISAVIMAASSVVVAIIYSL